MPVRPRGTAARLSGASSGAAAPVSGPWWEGVKVRSRRTSRLKASHQAEL
jgi:hypothetical protein